MALWTNLAGFPEQCSGSLARDGVFPFSFFLSLDCIYLFSFGCIGSLLLPEDFL